MQAYGEVIWFGGRVTGLTFVSFIFMVGQGQRLSSANDWNLTRNGRWSRLSLRPGQTSPVRLEIQSRLPAMELAWRRFQP